MAGPGAVDGPAGEVVVGVVAAAVVVGGAPEQ